MEYRTDEPIGQGGAVFDLIRLAAAVLILLAALSAAKQVRVGPLLTEKSESSSGFSSSHHWGSDIFTRGKIMASVQTSRIRRTSRSKMEKSGSRFSKIPSAKAGMPENALMPLVAKKTGMEKR